MGGCGGWVGHSLIHSVCGMDTHAGVLPAVSTQHHTACLHCSRTFNDTSPEVFIPNY